jgi:hypothetical protein
LRRDAPIKAAVVAEEAVIDVPVDVAVGSTEAPAPRRRGRPRKVVDDVVAEG